MLKIFGVEGFQKIRCKSNDDLPLNRPMKLCLLTIIIRSVFCEDGKFYPQLFLDEACFDVNKTSAWKECELYHYWFFKDSWFKFEEYVCNRCHDLLAMAQRGLLLNVFW